VNIRGDETFKRSHRQGLPKSSPRAKRRNAEGTAARRKASPPVSGYLKIFPQEFPVSGNLELFELISTFPLQN
jgi:hypothetical protein